MKSFPQLQELDKYATNFKIFVEQLVQRLIRVLKFRTYILYLHDICLIYFRGMLYFLSMNKQNFYSFSLGKLKMTTIHAMQMNKATIIIGKQNPEKKKLLITNHSTAWTLDDPIKHCHIILWFKILKLFS